MSSGRTQPRRPSHLSGYAEACLQALAERGLGEKISVGGALGLLQRHWFLGEFLDALKSDI